MVVWCPSNVPSRPSLIQIGGHIPIGVQLRWEFGSCDLSPPTLPVPWMLSYGTTQQSNGDLYITSLDWLRVDSWCFSHNLTVLFWFPANVDNINTIHPSNQSPKYQTSRCVWLKLINQWNPIFPYPWLQNLSNIVLQFWKLDPGNILTCLTGPPIFRGQSPGFSVEPRCNSGGFVHRSFLGGLEVRHGHAEHHKPRHWLTDWLTHSLTNQPTNQPI